MKDVDGLFGELESLNRHVPTPAKDNRVTKGVEGDDIVAAPTAEEGRIGGSSNVLVLVLPIIVCVHAPVFKTQ